MASVEKEVKLIGLELAKGAELIDVRGADAPIGYYFLMRPADGRKRFPVLASAVFRLLDRGLIAPSAEPSPAKYLELTEEGRFWASEL